MDQPKVFLYALSTCGHCRSVKNLLDANNVKYDYVYVDLLDKAEMNKAIDEVRKLNPQTSFPVTVIGEEVIVGYREPELMQALGLTTTQDLYDRLKKVNEPKGYYFSDDHTMVMRLLDGLLANKERYGYMSCPCRLASADREHDKDIICPCDYREPDVAEFGSCYCNLYVSKEWLDNTIPRVTVPERRPADKFTFQWPGGDA